MAAVDQRLLGILPPISSVSITSARGILLGLLLGVCPTHPILAASAMLIEQAAFLAIGCRVFLQNEEVGSNKIEHASFRIPILGHVLAFVWNPDGFLRLNR